MDFKFHCVTKTWLFVTTTLKNTATTESLTKTLAYLLVAAQWLRCMATLFVQTADVNPTTLNNLEGRGISVLSALPPTYVYSNITVASPGKGIWMHQRMPLTDKHKVITSSTTTLLIRVMSASFTTLPFLAQQMTKKTWIMAFTITLL
jgi:hypothetical protein